jgi:serine/threonine protein phosphatase PrpC
MIKEALVISPSGDALQQRIERFVREVRLPRSFNSIENISVGTNVGGVREQNQDRALIAFARYPHDPKRSFLLGVVCDGMGGLSRGDEAATLAIGVFVSRVIRDGRQRLPDRLRSAAIAANEAVYRLLRGRGGTTISAAFIGHDRNSVGLNAGDSRIYGVTRDREAKQLSHDDTLARLLGDSPSAREHQNKLVQFVGMGEGIEPQIMFLNGEYFGSILLTSDGVHSAPPEAFSQVIRSPVPNTDVVRRLITLSEILGGRDNGTALILPTQFEQSNGSGEQGLSLELLSAADRLEVWIPLGLEEGRQSTAVPNGPVETNKPKEGEAEITRKGRKNARHRQKVSKKPSRDDTRLPIEDEDRPTLDVRFPSSKES